MKRISIKLRVTLWFTLLMLVLGGLALGLLFYGGAQSGLAARRELLTTMAVSYTHLLDRAVICQRFQIPFGRADGHAHIGAGVPVRYREDVELIHLTALVGNAIGTADHAVSQNRTFYHLASTP